MRIRGFFKGREYLKIDRSERKVLAAINLIMDASPEIREYYEENDRVDIEINIQNLPGSIEINTGIVEVKP